MNKRARRRGEEEERKKEIHKTNSALEDCGGKQGVINRCEGGG